MQGANTHSDVDRVVGEDQRRVRDSKLSVRHFEDDDPGDWLVWILACCRRRSQRKTKLLCLTRATGVVGKSCRARLADYVS